MRSSSARLIGSSPPGAEPSRVPRRATPRLRSSSAACLRGQRGPPRDRVAELLPDVLLFDRHLLAGQGIEERSDLRVRDVVAAEETINSICDLRNVALGESLRDDTFNSHFAGGVGDHHRHAIITVVEQPLSGLQKDLWVANERPSSLPRPPTGRSCRVPLLGHKLAPSIRIWRTESAALEVHSRDAGEPAPHMKRIVP